MKLKFVISMSTAIFATISISTFAITEEEAQSVVSEAFASGQSANAIVESLLEQGLSLEQISALSVNDDLGPYQIELAKAAICASRDTQEAELVGNAALSLSPEQVLYDEIRGAMETYETTGCLAFADTLLPPPVYSPSNTGSLGGVIPPGSPAN